ncbi:sigma-70 family RNA polymerase sigma factor [Nonomuraea lactucae]|uniref:sigma-70 family RNA polymerase sigma factor n=1 Tax=Nonomuraea lactucae TaxID=2249762 RepID=UPI000DE4D240|nr:sigma-70 family RNA polymerase sigma factor [Nonomuraea lactucae]
MPTRTDDLVEAWHAMRERLLAFVASRVDTPQDAEDIVQEVFIKIGKGIGGLRDEQRLEAWIYQMTRNAVVDHRRALARAGNLHVRLVAERAWQPEDSQVDDHPPMSALTGCLAPLLRRLPERDRQAITLVDYEGLTQVEAARRAGISVSGMKSRVQRARSRLRELLTDCCMIAMDVRGGVREVQAEGPCPCACRD